MDQIEFKDFQKIKMKVGKIIFAERVENSDNLIKMKVNIGDEEIQIVSGIAKWYSPEELIGLKPVVVVNLEPAKFKGEISQGMILAAEKDERVVLVSPSQDIETGADVF